MTTVYINLPVKDLNASIAFYESLGFIKNQQFSDENASCVVYDESVYVMLLTHGFMGNYLPAHKKIADSHSTCEVLNAIQMSSREDVDSFFEKAIGSGGKKTIETQDL
jgi:uncharacterized protein